MKKKSAIDRKQITFFTGISILIGLYLTSRYSYLLFHSLAEIFSIITACSIFIITWNSRRSLDNNCLLFLGTAYLFVGGLDLLHLLSYKGMGVFTGFGANLPTQLWIAARYVESFSLLISMFLFDRKLRLEIVVLSYVATATLLLGFIFYCDLFPICFVEETGLTPFKKISEYIIALILIAAMLILIKKRSRFDENVHRLLLVSILLTIISELTFAVYVDVYGFFNLLGHYFKIISFYLIYKGIVQTCLTKPFSVLFRNLKKSEESLRSAGEQLEQRVHERTQELYQINEQLKREVEDRILAQEELRRAELRYRTVADFTYDWEYWLDHDGILQYISPSCERITGYNACEFIESPDLIRNIIEPEDREDWNNHFKESHAKPGPRKFEFRIRRRDGRIRWIEHVCQPVMANNGEFRGLRASNRDITKRREVEESLQQSKENFRLLADRLLKAQESERRRLAREMHDDMTQQLAVLAIDAGKMEHELAETPGPNLEKLRHMKERLVALSADIHAISRRLHPSIIDDLGLADAIESECTDFSRRKGILVNYATDNVPTDVATDVALSVYRVVQEGLRNVAKHAGATEVNISLTGSDTSIHLLIEDNGKGFDYREAKKIPGLGLASMEERIHLIQGRFSITTIPGKGTTIEVSAPIKKDKMRGSPP
jgi:PAS domain S-box-containing protein